MSRGRHSRPRARGGGLPALLAVALAGGAVAVAAAAPSARTLRLGLVGLALVGSFQLLLLARSQRTNSRAVARTEDRLRTLEQRNRDEGDELHRRVLAGVAREGELRRSVEVLVDEIARLRMSLESLIPVTTMVAPLQTVTPQAVAAVPAEPVAGVDIPLIQRVLAAQEEVAAPVPVPQPVDGAVPAPEPYWPAAAVAAVAVPPAEDTWRAPARPEYVPAPTAAAPVDLPVEVPVTSWIVRELQLEEPGAAVTMRILDITTPPAETAATGGAEAGPDADYEPTSTWSAFARPA